MTAIVLAGHGSQVSPETGGLVRRAADILRGQRVADEATAAFWKERPGFSEIADTLQSKKMIVVPVFAARGWYTDVVLPRELAKGRKDVEYVITPPIGEHRRMVELIDEAARSGIVKAQTDDVAVVIVGHGTPKYPASRELSLEHAERFRKHRMAAGAVAVFLDDEPRIPEAFRLCRSQALVVVPNFIALGSHAGDDVLEAFGLSGLQREGETNGRRIIYAPPNLTAVEIGTMASDLAFQAAQ